MPRAAQRKMVALGKKAGTACQVLSLNMAWGKAVIHIDRPSVSQHQALTHLTQKSEKLVEASDAAGHALRCRTSDWEAKLATMGVSYTGEVVDKALPLALEQILPGLPPQGRSACVELVNLCEGEVRRCLEDPSLILRGQTVGTGPLPKARVLCTQAEWVKIGRALLQKGLVRTLSKEQLFHVQGQPLLNGAFGVTKPGKFARSGAPVLRLIMDLRPSNHIQVPIVGDIASLAGPQVLRISGDDLMSAFYLFKLPTAWHPLFAFEKPLKHCDVHEGSGDSSEVYLAATVMPMGWLSAVGILQHAHRRLATVISPQGLPLSAEVRRDAPLPNVQAEFGKLWHLYLDDSTFLEWLDVQAVLPLDQKQATTSDFQQALQRIYQDWEIPWSHDKSLSRQSCAVRLGAELDGDAGLLGVSMEKRLELFELAFFLLSQDKVARKGVQIFLGKAVHILQFRHPFIQCLWQRVLGPAVSGPFNRKERQEVFQILSALPCLETNLRAKISGLVTASDASEAGGGMCRGDRQSLMGHYIARLEGLGQSTIPRPLNCNGGVLVFEWFSGIGGLRQALDLLHIPFCKAIVCERDALCTTIYRRHWPIDVHWRDVTQVLEQHVQQLFLETPHVNFVVQGAGSPLQGFTGIDGRHSDRREQEWSALLRVQSWVATCCQQRGIAHFGFRELVVDPDCTVGATQEPDQWKKYYCCSSGCSLVERPRYYYTSSHLVPDQDVNFRVCSQGTVIDIRAATEPHAIWLSSPWEWLSGVANTHLRFPMFTRSLPRKTPPDHVDVSSLRESVFQRWAAEQFKFPPQTYNEQFLLSDGSHKRILCAAEKEVLLGFPRSHTRPAFKVVTAGTGEDARQCLIGNAFHCIVVANLLRMGLKAVGWQTPLPLAPEICNRRSLELSQLPCEKPPFSFRSAMPVYDSVEDTEMKFASVTADLGITLSLEDHASVSYLQHQTALPHFFLRRAEYRGSDVCLDTGMLMRPEKAPRLTINPHLWKWTTVLSWPWRHREHINILELLATLKSFRWRSRSKRFYRARVMHLLDSQVCLAVLVKGRSSSIQLNRILQRLAALLLACDVLALFAYIKSEFNPADLPSRRHGKASVCCDSGRPSSTKKAASLRDNLVKPATRSRYSRCFHLFVLFLRQQLGYLPATSAEYDVWLCRYIEFLWREGESKAVASTTLAGVQFFVPQLRKQLSQSWKLKAKWDRLELPCQASPMTPQMLFAFAAIAFQKRWDAFAWLCILMFLGFLRTGEALSLLVKHVQVSASGVVLTLCDTKGAQRAPQEHFEEILIEDALATSAANALLKNKRPGDLLAGLSTYKFRQHWFDIVSHFHLQGLHFHPYSLRRGGATYYFQRTGNMHRTLLLGRWKHLSTARLYLKEARAAVQDLTLPTHVQSSIRAAALKGRQALRCQLGTHGRGKTFIDPGRG